MRTAFKKYLKEVNSLHIDGEDDIPGLFTLWYYFLRAKIKHFRMILFLSIPLKLGLRSYAFEKDIRRMDIIKKRVFREGIGMETRSLEFKKYLETRREELSKVYCLDITTVNYIISSLEGAYFIGASEQTQGRIADLIRHEEFLERNFEEDDGFDDGDSDDFPIIPEPYGCFRDRF